jgi:hypothetical protein
VLQKIEHVCGSVSLGDQGHSPCARGEGHLQQLYACDGLQNRSQHLEAWTTTDSHDRHCWKEEKENLHTKSYKAKLERLRSVRLTRRDQAIRLLDMQSLQVVKGT